MKKKLRLNALSDLDREPYLELDKLGTGDEDASAEHDGGDGSEAGGGCGVVTQCYAIEASRRNGPALWTLRL